MRVPELLGELETLGVQLWEESGQLRFRAPQGVLTEARREALKEHKQAVLELLRAGRIRQILPDEQGRHEPFPLTDVQAAYLLGRQDVFDYGGVSCQVYGELEFTGLDTARLQAAWDHLLRRHDMLRAVIHADGYQQVLPEVPRYRIAKLDLRGTGHDGEELRRVRSELSHRTYSPHQWPLFELRVSRAEDRDLLHVSIDFLIADYLSIQQLLSELTTLYENPAAQLPALEITFRDYRLAERQLYEGARYERDRAYWWGRLDDLPAAPELPILDAQRSSTPARFRRFSATLPAQQWAALRRRAGEHQLTPSGAVLAAYAEVLRRWSRRPRFTLNLTLLNRQPLHPQVQHLVGDFTTVSLLAVEPAATAGFRDHAVALQQQLWEDMDHPLCSGVEVMRELARRRGRSAALMPVVFTSTIGLGAEATPRTGQGQLRYGISQTPQVWIDCQAVERAGELVLNWDVREGVLPEGLAGDMFDVLHLLLRQLATTGEAWQRREVIALPPDQLRRRREINDTAGSLPSALLHEGVVRQSLRTPGEPAVISTRRTLTYQELLARAAGVAGELRAAGCQPGEQVAVVMDKGWEQVVAVLGVLLAGSAYVPVDTTAPIARRDQMIGQAGVRHVLTQSWRSDGPWPQGVSRIAVDTLAPAEPPAALPARLAEPDDLAYVIFTSGSTGTPKGVMISHRSAGNTIEDVNRRFGVGPGDRVFGLANLGFDLSVYDLFGPLAVGGCLVLPEAGRRADPSHWAELVRQHQVSIWNSVPAQLQMLLHYLEADPAAALASLRLALLSGDWIPVSLPGQIRARIPGLEVVSLGGATEAAIWSIHYRIREVPDSWRSIPYGTPLTNQTFHVLDSLLTPCPDWVGGELYIGGVGLARGYLGDLAKTAASFVSHPVTEERLYRTGDMGRYLPDGNIEFLGREDTQVKIRGHRIELAEVEAAVQAHDAIAAGAVLVDGDQPLERRLVAFAQPARRSGDDEPWEAAGDALACAAADAAASILAADPAQFAEFVRQLDDVALTAMLVTLRELGLVLDGSAHTAAEVLAITRVAPAHHGLVRRWLRVLIEHGLLVRADDGRYRAARPVDPAVLTAAWNRLEQLRAQAGYPDEVLCYLRRSTARLAELLRGELDPLQLLFPEGRMDTVQSTYRDYLIGNYVNELVTGAVRHAAAQRHDAGPLRVLEVGAGVGGTSEVLIPALSGAEADYLFTDVSQFFLTNARERFAEYPWVRYGRFDLNEHPRAQGLLPNSFDVIVAGNVLHYARHAGQTLGRLRELLRPGGWLVFLEATRDTPWVMASMELIEGEGEFEDLRWGRDQTFLSRRQWLDLLAETGAHTAVCLPAEGEQLSAVGQHVFAAQFKADVAVIDAEVLQRFLAQRLPDYMIPQQLQVVDALPLTSNGKIDRAVLRSWVSRHGENAVPGGDEPTDDLERRIAGLWAELLAVPRVSRDHDFFQLGGDSLVASQLAGRMRENLPEASGRYFDSLLRQLLQEPTVAAMAAFLREALPAREAADAPPQASPLVPLGGSGPGPLQVLVHEGGGTMAPYIALARELAARGRVAGLAVTKVDTYLRQDPEGLIDRLADEYAGLLLAQEPGPIHIIGYHTGAALALEVARRLTEAGTETSLTVISGGPLPVTADDELLLERTFAETKGLDANRLLGPLAARPQPERLAAIGAALTGSRDDLDAEGFLTAHLSVFRHSITALSQHQAAPYAGDVTYLRPASRPLPWTAGDLEAAWRELCLGELRVRDLPADHPECLSAPHAAEVAGLLSSGVMTA